VIDVLLLVLVGIAFGTAAGLIPGIHPNTFAVLMTAAGPALLTVFSPLAVVVGIVCMAVVNTFVNFIPATFLGAPDAETALPALPLHRFLLAGRAYEAIYLTVIGGVCVILLSLLFLPLLLIVLPLFFSAAHTTIPWILVGITAIMIMTERSGGKAAAAGVMVLVGLVGILATKTSMPPQFALFLSLPDCSGRVLSSLERFRGSLSLLNNLLSMFHR
jgi:putative membrane protein